MKSKNMNKLRFLTPALFLINPVFSQQKVTAEKDTFLFLEPVEVRATRAGDKAPFTRTNITKSEIEKHNLGQDLPFILNQTPSVVVNSDAGNGVGYTGIRIRGTDASRINVTLNGIPFNDAESQGTFFVDLPDFISSVGSIQVQRGVGTSSNGPGAFGATINISTNETNRTPYVEFNNNFGSFNTWKNTIKTGSGVIGDHFTTDLRLSRISSDGYIDRASSDLKSFYFSTAYLDKKSTVRFNIFSGKEKTYQAWYGVSANDLEMNRTINYAGMERSGEPYHNETDNYKQDHYQLFFTRRILEGLNFNTALYYVKGNGYYEQYKADEAYADYNFPEPVYGTEVITHTDLVRQLWLDNDFYGNIFSLQYRKKNSEMTLGGGWNRYEGNHFGEVIWAEKGLSLPARWYDLDADKRDLNVFFKHLIRLSDDLNIFYDLQYRDVDYEIGGFRDNPLLFVNNNYSFFNPKAGLSYTNKDWNIYFSYSRGQKEPNRDDFEAGLTQAPKPEKLNDFEMGIEKTNRDYSIGAFLYYMQYEDQLVLNGKINDVGAYTRINIPKSYRTGIELVGSSKIMEWFHASFNLTLSRNKVLDFTEFIDDYDVGGQKDYSYSSTDIAFSPSIITGYNLVFKPFKNLDLAVMGKYTGKQYLDNTQNENRKLDPYYVQDLQARYSIPAKILKQATLVLQVNNAFNDLYEPNGYTFSYFYGGELITENYYYPMAGRNFIIGLNLRF